MRIAFVTLVAITAGLLSLSTLRAEDSSGKTDGWVELFDGKSLEHWDGNPKFWSVEDGAITGRTTPENPTNGNTFLIWRGGEVGNFELTLDYKIVGGNSGIQYRSFEVENEKWVIGGYQADIDSGATFSGINYGERFRGILANRGQRTTIGADHQPKVEEQFADSNELQSKIKPEEWNSYRVVAKDFRFQHYINGVLMSDCTDADEADRRPTGVLALQLHAGPPMVVQFKNIRIKHLDDATAAVEDDDADETAEILLLAGHRSHGFGAHDHTAGCGLLAKLLNASGLPVHATAHSLEKSGWPTDEQLEHADTVVIYADGGEGHPFHHHLDQVKELWKDGTGIVCIHYGTEVTAGATGDAFLDFTGGYFEMNWSVNPHWTAHFKSLPKHSITSGVQPFSTNDEWYYHMRFRDGMEGVEPILTDLPPVSTMERPDGPHSGNPAVRKAIANKEPQHVAWARDPEQGGRGFGCTGGHFHWNWGNDQFRKLVLNAIVWTAGVDVPTDGVPAGKVTVDDLLENHDEEIPADFNRDRIEALLLEWNGQKSAT